MSQLISYSQNGEDIFLNRIFRNQKKGFYLDIGAGHPIDDSVTALFYFQGWTGINIEPDPNLFEILSEKRVNDVNLNICISEESSEKLIYVSKISGWTTTKSEVASKFGSIPHETLKVQSRTLEDIFNLCPPQIDFLKMDCEGSEVEILKSTHFKLKRPRVIVVEVVKPHSNGEIEPEIDNILESHMYIKVHFDGLNSFYVDQNRIDEFNGVRFNQVSVLDDFKKIEQINVEKQNEKLISELTELEQIHKNDIDKVNELEFKILQVENNLSKLSAQLIEEKRLRKDDLEKRDSEINGLINELSEVNKKLALERHESMQIQSNLRIELQSLKLEISLLQQSLSWRITRPLRTFKATVLKRIDKLKKVSAHFVVNFVEQKYIRTHFIPILKKNRYFSKLAKRLLARARMGIQIEPSALSGYRYVNGDFEIPENRNLDLGAFLTIEKDEINVPLLSICVSTFNRCHWLKKSLIHLLDAVQEYHQFIELVVVDNASTDGTSEFLNALAGRDYLKVHINETNVGMLGNLEICSKVSEGRFVWILGDDDFVNPQVIPTLLKVIQEFPSINLIYGNYRYSNFEVSEFTSYEDLYLNSALITPETSSRFVYRISEIAVETPNFFTAIYCTIFRKDHADRCFADFDEEAPFESLAGCVPTTKYVLENLLDSDGYWIGRDLITINTNVSWLKYSDIWVLERFPEIYYKFETKGCPSSKVDILRKESIHGVIFHLEDAVNKKNLHRDKISFEYLVKGYWHINEFQKILPKLVEIASKDEVLSSNLVAAIEAMENSALDIHVEGPIFGSYSLARVNRGVAIALHEFQKNTTIGPSPTEGDLLEVPEEYIDAKFIPYLIKDTSRRDAQVLLRNTYPPVTDDMHGDVNLIHSFGWEETEFPREFVKNLNSNLQGITVMSHFVKKVLMDNGVKIPIKVSGLGIDFQDEIGMEKIQSNSRFRFLSISSAFARKGIDVLIESFCAEFSSEEKVELLIKTTPNAHNNVASLIDRFKELNPKMPTIILIEEDWVDDSKISNLYKSSDVLVASSRGEGFGWPVAEALIYGVPVIATSYSGHLEILDFDYPWLLDFQFRPSESHFNSMNSIWVEPNVVHLQKLMRAAFNTPKEQLIELAQHYKTRLLSKASWRNSASQIQLFTRELVNSKAQIQSNFNLYLLTTWNDKCGIAEYSHELFNSKNFPEINLMIRDTAIGAKQTINQTQIVAKWNFDDMSEVTNLSTKSNSVILIQYQPSFFEFAQLSRVVDNFLDQDNLVFIFLHNVEDFCNRFESSHYKTFSKNKLRIMVHNHNDLNLIKVKTPFLLSKTIHFPHPAYQISNLESTNKQKDKKIISFFGFLHDKKGIDVLMRIFAILKETFSDAELYIYSARLDERSDVYKKKCEEVARHLKIENSINWNLDFLEKQNVIKKLSDSDLIILPYADTTESSSGAARICLASGAPLVVSTSQIFDDLDKVVERIDVKDIELSALKCLDLLKNPEKAERLIERQNKYLGTYNFNEMSHKLRDIIDAYSELFN